MKSDVMVIERLTDEYMDRSVRQEFRGSGTVNIMDLLRVSIELQQRQIELTQELIRKLPDKPALCQPVNDRFADLDVNDNE